MRRAAALLLLFTAALPAQELVRVEVSPTAVTVGDPVEIVYTVTAPAAELIRLTPFPESLPGAEIISTADKESNYLIGLRRFVRIVRLVPFEVGDLAVPQLNIEVQREAGITDAGRTPPAVISVRSVAPGPEGPVDAKALKDIVEPPVEQVWLSWAAGGAAVLLLAALVWWWLRRRRAPLSVRRMVARTPAQRALDDLAALLESGLLEAGEFKQFFSDLADIVRRYLGLRYHVTALEMTSTELRMNMEQLWRQGPLAVDDLSSLLHACDMVKFAKFSPSEQEAGEEVGTARHIVEATRDDIERPAGGAGKEAA